MHSSHFFAGFSFIRQQTITSKWEKTLHSVTVLGGLSDPFQGLSDLHLGDQKVTWKKLAQNVYFEKNAKGFEAKIIAPIFCLFGKV